MLTPSCGKFFLIALFSVFVCSCGRAPEGAFPSAVLDTNRSSAVSLRNDSGAALATLMLRAGTVVETRHVVNAEGVDSFRIDFPFVLPEEIPAVLILRSEVGHFWSDRFPVRATFRWEGTTADLRVLSVNESEIRLGGVRELMSANVTQARIDLQWDTNESQSKSMEILIRRTPWGIQVQAENISRERETTIEAGPDSMIVALKKFQLRNPRSQAVLFQWPQVLEDAKFFRQILKVLPTQVDSCHVEERIERWRLQIPVKLFFAVEGSSREALLNAAHARGNALMDVPIAASGEASLRLYGVFSVRHQNVDDLAQCHSRRHVLIPSCHERCDWWAPRHIVFRCGGGYGISNAMAWDCIRSETANTSSGDFCVRGYGLVSDGTRIFYETVGIEGQGLEIPDRVPARQAGVAYADIPAAVQSQRGPLLGLQGRYEVSGSVDWSLPISMAPVPCGR